MLELEKYKNIILASGSPRRKYLLEQIGLAFTVASGDVNEEYPEDLTPEEVAVYLAEKKAVHFSHLLTDNETLIITADTLVLLHDRILGKPGNQEQARAMLESLSGNKHTVITGVTIKSLVRQKTFVSHTNVYFTSLSGQEIGYYLEHFKPYDKAGSYGIQEWIGYIGIERIEGSYFNVMGLPVQKLYHELLNF